MTRRPATNDSERRQGFQPGARRRNRIAAGVALAAVAIGGNILVYSALRAAEPTVQVTVDVPAGTQISADMLRTVEVDADSSVNLVVGSDMSTIVGQYAKVRLVAGSLVVTQAVQPEPLVNPGNAVVAISVKEGALPVGLRERVAISLVLPLGPAEPGEPRVIAGRVAAPPTTTSTAIGTQSLSVEVAAADAPSIAAADDVRVVLSEPSADPSGQD